MTPTDPHQAQWWGEVAANEDTMKRPVENLSRRQRQGTPHAFADYLIARVRAMFPAAHRIAALYIMRRSHYSYRFPLVEPWGVGRNADIYPGPHPVIAHPPCGPWGKYRANCHQSRHHGILAMQFVHQWGGVVEQPVGSSLFRDHGTTGIIEQVNQGDYGHLALKPTLLYWVGEPTRRDTDVRTVPGIPAIAGGR